MKRERAIYSESDTFREQYRETERDRETEREQGVVGWAVLE